MMTDLGRQRSPLNRIRERFVEFHEVKPNPSNNVSVCNFGPTIAMVAAESYAGTKLFACRSKIAAQIVGIAETTKCPPQARNLPWVGRLLVRPC